MKIDVLSDMDNRPRSIFRALVESLLGPHWEDYVTVYIKEQDHLTGVFFRSMRYTMKMGRLQ
jgi:hypothetical protein